MIFAHADSAIGQRITAACRDAALPRLHPNGDNILTINALCGCDMPRPYRQVVLTDNVIASARAVKPLVLNPKGEITAC